MEDGERNFHMNRDAYIYIDQIVAPRSGKAKVALKFNFSSLMSFFAIALGSESACEIPSTIAVVRSK